jgi:transposase-like protein
MLRIFFHSSERLLLHSIVVPDFWTGFECVRWVLKDEERKGKLSLRRKYETALKTRAAPEAIRGQKTIAETAREVDVPANLVTLWKKAALENLPGTFSRKAGKKERDWEEERNDLYRQIGQLKVELEWLKKKLSSVR